MRKLLTIVPLFLLLTAAGAAAQSGEALRATFDSGVKAYDAGDFAGAFKIWSSIDDVDLAAMRNVALMLRRGQGVAKDPKKAEEFYETAAEAGLPTAQADLADMLLKGEAGPPDPKRALPLLVAAAAADHPVAEYELAQMYETGGLVPQDMATARNLYTAAASHGMTEAQARLDALPPAPAPQNTSQDTVRLMQPAPTGTVPSAAAPADLRPEQH